MITIEFEEKEYTLSKFQYPSDHSLGVYAAGPSGTQDEDSYGSLTVFLDVVDLPVEHQFFNINGYHAQELLKLLIQAQIVELTDYSLRSGFIEYPLVKWHI